MAVWEERVGTVGGILIACSDVLVCSVLKYYSPLYLHMYAMDSCFVCDNSCTALGF